MTPTPPQRSETPLRERETSGLTRERLGVELRRAVPSLVLLLVLILAAFIAIVIISRNIGAGSPFADRYEIKVAVDDAKGVVPGAQEVRLAGVPLGKITGLKLVDGLPQLTISIDRKYAPLYRDARLRLRPQTALQNMYLDIESRGSPAAGALSEGQTLAAERTQTPVDISRVLNVFDTPTRARLGVLTDEFARGLGDDGDLLRKTFVQIVPFLRAAQRLTRETATRRELTRRLVHNFGLVVDELGRRDQQLASLVASGNATLSAVGQASAPLDRLLTELPPTLEQLRGTSRTLNSSLARLDPAARALRPTADALEPALASLRSFGAAARPAFSSLRSVTRELLPLTDHLQPFSVELEKAFKPLDRSVPRLDRVSGAIVPCELAVRKFFQFTPSVLKFGDARGAYPRAEAVALKPGDLVAGPSCAPGRPVEVPSR